MLECIFKIQVHRTYIFCCYSAIVWSVLADVVVITRPFPSNEGMTQTAVHIHAVNLIKSRLGERWQPISNQSWVTVSSHQQGRLPLVGIQELPFRTCWVSKFTIVIWWSTDKPPVCHIKVEASRWVPWPRTQQASLPACSPHCPFYMLSAKQGSCEYHFLKSFDMTPLRE